MNNIFVSILSDSIIKFVEYKRYCGFKYQSEVNVLMQFDKYYNSLNHKEIIMNREIVEKFLVLKENERIANQQNKASIIRNYINFLISNNYVKNAYIIPSISKRGEKEFIPHIFSKEELRKIISYFETYDDNVKINKGCFVKEENVIESITTIINMLMFTGMRISEILNLKISDVDLENNLIYIKVAKNDNKRIVPFSSTLQGKIKNYLNQCQFLNARNNELLFFSVDNNKNIKPIKRNKVYYYLKKSLKYNNINNINGKSPRLHDFRHTFATMSLKKMCEKEENINLICSFLSTYLGHKSFEETQKYIWLTPELFNKTKLKMEEYSSFIEELSNEAINE